jgi:hypothetical protein
VVARGSNQRPKFASLFGKTAKLVQDVGKLRILYLLELRWFIYLGDTELMILFQFIIVVY